ncbi:hypothetical protein RA264_28075, partial [Pseudomonas syringae pv. tagetis]|uniref:hypothetical protein n=1 Tax=Pseudomonas syringae group genomosp. 7 TaxID=251699 RepID=UPI00376FF0F7
FCFGWGRLGCCFWVCWGRWCGECWFLCFCGLGLGVLGCLVFVWFWCGFDWWCWLGYFVVVVVWLIFVLLG